MFLVVCHNRDSKLTEHEFQSLNPKVRVMIFTALFPFVYLHKEKLSINDNTARD